MNCPYCNKEMQIMWSEPQNNQARIPYQWVVGRCWDCDFDAEWEIETDSAGNETVHNFRRYFFG